MDDYTWNKKMLARRRKRSLQTFFIFFLVAGVIASVVWYFFIYTRTPEYALKELSAGLASRNAETFTKYVDAETLTASAYDDLTVDMFAYDTSLPTQTKVLFEKYYAMIKPQLTAGVRDSIATYLNTGEWAEPEGTNILKGRQLGIDFESFMEKTLLPTTEFVSLGEVKKIGDNATAIVNIRHTSTGTEFPLQVALAKKEEGWQVTSLKNYRTYLNTIMPLVNKDIQSYLAATKDIVDEYNYIFTIQRSEFSSLGASSDGRLSDSQRNKLKKFIQDEVIPAVKKRQSKLDEIEAPAGAKFLAGLRKESTELTIESWQSYVKGLEGNTAEFENAETAHKKMLEIDLRIEDIINHSAMSQNLPNIP